MAAPSNASGILPWRVIDMKLEKIVARAFVGIL